MQNQTSLPPGERVLRDREVTERVGFSRNHLLKLEKAGRFPKRRRVGARAAGWLESDVDAWLRALPTVAEAPPDAAGNLPARGHVGRARADDHASA